MSLLDQNLVFSDSQTATFTTSTASTSFVDLSGGALFSFGQNAATFGEDIGVGFGAATPTVAIYTGTVAPSTTNSATLNIQFQGSTDSNTWTTYAESGAITPPLTVSGGTAFNPSVKLWEIDIPRRIFGAVLPRYLRVNYAIPGSTSFSNNTNSTLSAFIELASDDAGTTLSQYPSNFAVGV